MRRGIRHLAEGSSSSSEAGPAPRLRPDASASTSSADARTSPSKASLTSSIHRFRSDFEQLQCKARVFGESVGLCRCIAEDFQKRVSFMERRLQSLEQRQVQTTEKNYSAIIQKNQRLSHKMKQDAKA
ncbi:uncharacterized protein LOC123704451 [Colias croceus]|uniref:uncharacterized protein LOC123704451 n=1 Tax=Colias crocea TaxID=72248 RepID=UPI001E27C7BA|nr:uncharacterized protein LOC123704451 [Colias croceus]